VGPYAARAPPPNSAGSTPPLTSLLGRLHQRLIPLTQVRPYVVGAVLGVGRRLFGDCLG
jgi:hypothetical protein